MADPRGPDTGKGGKSGHSARPRPQTLDLSANDVTSKTDPAQAPEASPPPPASEKAEPAPEAAAAPRPQDPAPAGDPPAEARPEVSQAAPPKPETPARPAREAPAAAPERAPDRGGVGPVALVLAAVAAAALAVVCVALFSRHLIPQPQADLSRVAAAEGRIDKISADVAALRTELSKLAQAADISALQQRLAEAGKGIETLNGRLGAVDKEIAALAEKAARPVVDPETVRALDGRLDGVDLRLQALPTAEAYAAISTRQGEIEQRLKDTPTAQQIAALAARIGAIDGLVKEAVSPFDGRVAALEQRPIGDPTARQVVALAALERAVDAGRPFAAELSAAKASAQGSELAGVELYAATGVPTRAALSAKLGAIVAALPDAKSAQPTGGVLQRFTANAVSIVKVTPSGAAEAADVRGQLARFAAGGDLEQALATRETLEPADKAATDDWARQAASRIAADKSLAAARAAALARLTSKN